MPYPVAAARGKNFGTPPKLYLLYDAFTDTVAAGSVNGTASTPPGGVQIVDASGNSASPPTRTVTDTNSKLSIGSGVANFATGGVGSGDPGLWYPAITRAFGLVLLSSYKAGNAAGANMIGLDTNQSGDNGANSLQFIIGGLTTLEGGSTKPIIGSYDNVGTITYPLAIVLRVAGAYFFFKGGAFTNYSLVWIASVNNTGTLYPQVSARSTTSIFTALNIRIPLALYIPTPLAYSVFTQADGPLTVTDTVGPDGQVTPALAWTGSTYTISTNKAINTPTLGADVIVNGGFDADTDWNKGANWAIAAGVATATAASADLTAAVAPLTVGTWYSVTYTVSGFVGGTINAKLGSTAFPTHGANGTYTETGLALTTAFAMTAVGFTGSIDNVSCKPLTLAELFATILPSTADYLLDIDVTLESATSGKQAGIVSNLDSAVTPANFRLTYLDGRGNVVVTQFVAGVPTVKVTTAITYSAGKTLRSILAATALSPFYNGAASGAQQTMGANTNKLCGLFSTSPLSSLDVWQALARGTSGEYSGLDAL